MRQKEFIVEISVIVDAEEVDTEQKMTQKEMEIRRAIENLDCSIGVFQVENFQ